MPHPRTQGFILRSSGWCGQNIVELVADSIEKVKKKMVDLFHEIFARFQC